MSYSFSVTATSKAEAKAKVTIEMAKVVVNQAPHARESAAVVAYAHAAIDALSDNPQVITVNMQGSVSTTNWSDPAASLSYVGCSINVSGR